MPPPDADLHPSATGLAKETVDKHKEPQPLVLYAGWFCPFVQRVWTVLEEKKIPYQYVEVNPYHKPESLLKLNPRGLVPTLQYDNKPLYESVVVCEFLEEAYPDHGTKLFPSDPYDRAISRIWTDFITTRIIPSWHRFLQHQSGQTESSLKDVQSELLGRLKEFIEAMDQDGPYFSGGEATLIDFIMAPWAVRMWVFDHFKGGSGIPNEGKGGKDEQTWTRWRKWLAAIESRASIKNTTSEKQYFLPIYQR
jgi:glutathione S-transferase